MACTTKRNINDVPADICFRNRFSCTASPAVPQKARQEAVRPSVPCFAVEHARGMRGSTRALHHPVRVAGEFGKRPLAALEGPCDQVEKCFNTKAIIEKLDHMFEGESGLLAGHRQFVDGGQEGWAFRVRFRCWQL